MFDTDYKIILSIFVMSVLTAIIRFKTLISAISDICLGYMMGYISYMFSCRYFDSTDPTIGGIVGSVVLFSYPIYNLTFHWLTKNFNKLMEKWVK
jgi:xanthine/uracil permease